MSISLIVAADENNSIGYQNKLLCNLKGDLKYFKDKTKNQTIIMGRNTYESIGKPLPHRTNIVLTSDVHYDLHEEVYVYNSLSELMKDYSEAENDEEVFVIGGANVYEQFLPLADTIYLTRIHHAFDNADTFFPKMNMDEWKRVAYEVRYEDKDNDFDYTFLTYKRKEVKR
ncbi:dihydrofolate reductase [Priestia megaterium]|uniref:dihydrofolate reductase n=1 Tax=Priestia megaterium TaxID=1404 RepID=UPI003CC616D7